MPRGDLEWHPLVSKRIVRRCRDRRGQPDRLLSRGPKFCRPTKCAGVGGIDFNNLRWFDPRSKYIGTCQMEVLSALSLHALWSVAFRISRFLLLRLVLGESFPQVVARRPLPVEIWPAPKAAFEVTKSVWKTEVSGYSVRSSCLRVSGQLKISRCETTQPRTVGDWLSSSRLGSVQFRLRNPCELASPANCCCVSRGGGADVGSCGPCCQELQ